VQAGCQTASKIITRCVTHLTRFDEEEEKKEEEDEEEEEQVLWCVSVTGAGT